MKPRPFGGVQETPLRLPRRGYTPGRSRPGCCWAEVLPLCHGQCGTVLGPHQAPVKSSLSKCERKVRRRWLQQGICGNRVSEKGSTLTACQQRRFSFRKGWLWESKPWFGNMPAQLHPGQTSQAAPESCPGPLARLPGGSLTSTGHLSSCHFAFLVLGLQSCT